MDHRSLSSKLEKLLGLAAPAVAVSFAESAPAGVKPVPATEPAGCGYWRLAAQGRTFYTKASDHEGCPIGAHTHGVPLSPAKKAELEGMVGTMIGLEYIKMEEVPSIPSRKKPFDVAIYAPLAEAPGVPDAVLVRGNARQLMLLAEAAISAGLAGPQGVMGRPTCAVLPLAAESGLASVSLGCIGNRVYTGLGDDEAYFAAPGRDLEKLIERLEVILKANRELEKFHRSRLA